MQTHYYKTKQYLKHICKSNNYNTRITHNDYFNSFIKRVKK